MTQDVNTVFADMPSSIKAYSVSNADLTYTIVVNARLCREGQLLAYYHEMKHIENGDYDREVGADMIEFHAHMEDSKRSES